MCVNFLRNQHQILAFGSVQQDFLILQEPEKIYVPESQHNVSRLEEERKADPLTSHIYRRHLHKNPPYMTPPYKRRTRMRSANVTIRLGTIGIFHLETSRIPGGVKEVAKNIRSGTKDVSDTQGFTV